MSILRQGQSHSVLRHSLATSGPLQRKEKQKWDSVAASWVLWTGFFSHFLRETPWATCNWNFSYFWIFLVFSYVTNVKAEAAHLCVGFLMQSSLANQYWFIPVKIHQRLKENTIPLRTIQILQMEKSRSNIAPIIPKRVPLSQVNVWIHLSCQHLIWLPLLCNFCHELAQASVTEQGLKTSILLYNQVVFYTWAVGGCTLKDFSFPPIATVEFNLGRKAASLHAKDVVAMQHRNTI